MQRPTGVVGFRVTPGEEQALESVDDIRITNIAFGEDVKGSGRTVVRVHHRRIPDFDDLGDLDDLDDDEDEEDEDDEDEDEDEDDEDEEDDDDDEEMDADETAAAPAKKVNGKVKANGAASALVDTEAEVDDEDEESLLEEEEEHTYILCSLYPGKIEQVSVDLSFTVADDVRFSVSGENAVEILGNIMKPSLLDTYDEEPDDDELISDYGSDDESIDSDEAMYAELEGEDSEGEEDDSERIEEIDEDEASEEDEAEPVAAVAKPAVAGKKRSAAEAEVDISDADISMTAPVSDAELAAAAKAAGFDPANLTKNQRKKLNKRLRGAASGDDSVEVKSATVAASADGKGKPEVTTAVKEAVKDGGKTASKEEVKKDGKTAAKVTKLPSGLTIEDRKVGTGPAAKAGNRLGMRYVGRLQGGKQFDANTKGKPFQFRLGKGEVISGWDEGLKGMQVGGERRLIVPPKMGYGARGAPPDIPGNATLVFDVKLVEIK